MAWLKNEEEWRPPVTPGRLENVKWMGFAALIVFALFLWQGNRGFSLADEGFLWYGAQRVGAGDVPLRDFMSYEPGRYYWSAAFMRMTGDDGIMTLRVAIAFFQALGLGVALWLIARCTTQRKWPYLLLSALVLVSWMLPRHKIFDISISIFLVGALALLVERPKPARYFFTGAIVGLAAVFGRNHGMYGLAGSLCTILWLNIHRNEEPPLAKAVALWAAGILCGFSPMVLMMLFVPGFADALWRSVLFLFEFGSTNLTLPVPWPWRAPVATLPPGEALRALLIGAFFCAMLAWGALSLVWLFRQRLRRTTAPPVLAAASFLVLPYAHFAFSRAEINHLAQGIFPLLIGCLGLTGSRPDRWRYWPSVGLLAVSLWVAGVAQPGWQCRSGASCENVEIAGSNLLVDHGTAVEVGLTRSLVHAYVPDGETFIAAPYRPGAYALLRRRSPVWEIYALFPRSDTFQRKEIERIEAARPRLAMMSDQPTDGREALRYSRTHPLILRYLQEHFVKVSGVEGYPFDAYRARDAVAKDADVRAGAGP